MLGKIKLIISHKGLVNLTGSSSKLQVLVEYLPLFCTKFP